MKSIKLKYLSKVQVLQELLTLNNWLKAGNIFKEADGGEAQHELYGVFSSFGHVGINDNKVRGQLMSYQTLW